MSQTFLVQADSPPQQGATWPLVEFDRVNFSLVLRGTWVFAQRLDTEKLRNSLATLLSSYPHYAGRMQKDGSVHFNNTGVPFTIQEAPHLSAPQIQKDHRLIDKLVPVLPRQKVRKGKSAPLQVTVTHIADGSVLTVYGSHALGDGNTFYNFVHYWSLVAQGKPAPTVLLDQSRHTKSRDIDSKELVEQAKSAGWQKLSILRLVKEIPYLLFGNKTERVGPLYFPPRALLALRKAAISEEAPNVRNNDALCAHFSLLCAQLLYTPPDQNFVQAIVLDLRERLAHLPKNFVGNAAFVIQGTSLHPDESLQAVAARTHKKLSPFLSKPSEPLTHQIQLSRDLISKRLLWLPYDPSTILGSRPTGAYINSFAKYPIYEVDFGTAEQPQTPLCVIPHNLPDPVVFWPAPPNQGGIEVYLTGAFARALKARRPDDPWWEALYAYHPRTP
ncbi:MAG: hypothetical protein H6727_13835 [Myxococcales bacterium]|nr:hypothetical protein [Myxococcales bacterium]